MSGEEPTRSFTTVTHEAVASFLRTEVAAPLERPGVPCIAGIGTVAHEAVRSPLLSRQLDRAGVEAWTTLYADGPEDLWADQSWDLAMVLSPHKQDVVARCHALTPAARATGVVDTLRRSDATVLGCNTNSAAAAAAVSMLVGRDEPGRVLIGGTGASTRSLVVGLRSRFPTASIGVWGRSSTGLAQVTGQWPDVDAVLDPGGWEADVVVNATTVGQSAGELPAGFALLHALGPGVRFFDLNNRSGPLQHVAVAAGCVTIAGVMMQQVTNALRVSLLVGPARPEHPEHEE